MTDNAFNAAGFIQVNLETGSIQSPSQTSMVVIPKQVVAALSPGAALRDAAAAWGNQRGAVFVKEVDIDATLDVFAQHIQGEVALMGLGNVSLEVFGDALLVKIVSTDEYSDTTVAILESFVAGYFSAAGDEAFQSTVLRRGETELLLYVGNDVAVSKIKGQLAKGVSPMDVVETLHKEVA